MSGVNPITLARPSKPYPEFPLFAHATGRWAKKIRGRLNYFGRWEDTDGALTKCLEQKDALQSEVGGQKTESSSAASGSQTGAWGRELEPSGILGTARDNRLALPFHRVSSDAGLDRFWMDFTGDVVSKLVAEKLPLVVAR
jgi:hypothetical protein